MRGPCRGGGTGLLREVGKLRARVCWVGWPLRAVLRVAHGRAERVGRGRGPLLIIVARPAHRRRPAGGQNAPLVTLNAPLVTREVHRQVLSVTP
jgi:hypothetical protein